MGKPKKEEIFSRGRDDWPARRRIAGFWRILVGLAFLGAAGVVVCSALGIVSWGVNIGWIVLLALLGAFTIACLLELQWFGVFMPLAGIATILNTQTEYLPQVDDQIGPIWIVATLLSIGFTVLFHRSWRRRYVHVIDHDGHHGKHDHHDQVIDQADDAEIFVDVNMGSTIKYVNSDDFQRAVLNCRLGSIKAYFDNAVIKGKEATIEIHASLSGIELYIPKNWSIQENIKNNMAGISEKNSRRGFDAKDEKTVYLTGGLNASGIEIVYV